ncbi:hypothetical protein G7Y89_g12165 [Cudoniella acicularis]|uniref:Uncharacterized protein n=1 Tax=Cudoniella acicularis TaxID=354080 RepID=A0A8H4R9E5_9HELO|nr:hypothetical protein G7Y89_g12165 [Cudoniella acicularis]
MPRRLSPELRVELRQQLGLENSRWKDAGALEPILYQLAFSNPDQNNYKHISQMLLNALFQKSEGTVAIGRSLWALNLYSNQLPAQIPNGIDFLHIIWAQSWKWELYIRINPSKFSFHCLDIRRPQARQCIFDLIYPRNNEPTFMARRQSQNLIHVPTAPPPVNQANMIILLRHNARRPLQAANPNRQNRGIRPRSKLQECITVSGEVGPRELHVSAADQENRPG